ncbi:DEAD/DEAH box helicase [Chryseosolibacter histidini]|uniref:DEAD/DEAH box helicase n=1 Tax=Chryseosolibacter histidini TaxID=2782349 RepID=UPI0020B3CFE3|nr:AAA domain-containing protein [Chryseosolibacter histidini]
MTNSIKNILRTYLRRLTNLSGNNRSLLLLRLSAEQLMDLHDIDFMNPSQSFEVIRSLIASRNIKLCTVLDSRVEASNEVSKQIKKLQRADQFLFEERGSYDLHVGWPFVRGKFTDGTPVRCPLLFFPVTIVQENNNWVLHVRPQAGVTFNKSFLLAYSYYNKVKLEEELLETNFEDFNIDSTVFRTQLYQLLKEKLEINFNTDNFRDELIAFKEYKKDEFDKTHRNGEMKLFPEAVLGIFPQAGSQLVPDYLHLIESNSIADLEEFFLNKNVKTDEQPDTVAQSVKEEKIYTPFQLDAYQENAIRAVKNGKSIVVQGPPGTGKSQLICNLMADAIASGKKALLVCQKRAALDVVYSRLKKKDLGDFVGLVHDFRNDRKTVFTKAARQIDNIETYRAANRSVDVIQTERRFFQVCRSIDHITEDLETFKKNLFDDKECGLSIKELYLTSDLQGETINIRQEYQHFTFPQLPDFLRKLRQYITYEDTFGGADYLWRERKSFSNFGLSDLKAMEKIIADVPAFQKQIETQFRDLLGIPLNLEDAHSLYKREDDILGMIALLKNETIYQYFLAMAEETDDETSLLWFSNVERVLMNCFQGPGPEVSLPSDQLGNFQEVLQRRMDARKNIFRLLRWKLFSKEKMTLHRVLKANDLPHNGTGMEILEQKIDNRLNLEHHLTSLKKKPWLIDMPLDYDHSQLKTWFTRQKLAIRAKIILNSLREIREAVNPKKFNRNDFNALMKECLSISGSIPEKKNAWQEYLTPYQLRVFIHDTSLEKAFLKTLRKDFDSLCEFDRLKENLLPYERDVIGRLHEAVGWDAPKQEALLQNSLRLAWIEHIEAKYPDLRSVSSRKMQEQHHELVRLVEEKQRLSSDILLLRARERIYERVEYNRLNNRVTYRDLYHQLTKKKKIWSLRKVVSDFEEEFLNLLPCWMASPESVSAIFPMKEVFDLVIFDEASQCFSERGIPAMYRGKQLLVAGDDMQLRPSEMYQIRWEDEDADNPDVEVDSLLALAERYLPTMHLQAHYRSRSLDLIDFSNRHFYEGRLQLLPDRNIINQQLPGIEFCKVDGVWENSTNPVEASLVVERVIELLHDHPEKEIGIVTFNAPQQVLILDMLEDILSKSGRKIPPTLFVKNIENVQGDEKDIIIFSVGYARDGKKKMNMQFGSLSMAGGENRLNVAVTRAREKIILICSIEPEDLRTEDLKNEGPKLLKKYLEFARDVHQRRFRPQQTMPVRQQSTWYLNNKLKQWGEQKFADLLQFEVDTLPLADLYVKDKGNNYLGMVRTDDAHYLSSLSVKDSFAYAPALFEQKNWDSCFVFSRNLWQDPEKVEEDLLRFIGTKMATI